MKKEYKINYIDCTITVTSSFYEKMQDPSTKEYAMVKTIRADYPEMKVVNFTHKTPSKYTSKSTGEKFNCNPFKNLTYDNMEKFIEGLPNGNDYMPSFKFLRYSGSVPSTSRYPIVRNWFIAQFPQFRKNPLFYLNNKVDVIDIIPFVEAGKANSEDSDPAEREDAS